MIFYFLIIRLVILMQPILFELGFAVTYEYVIDGSVNWFFVLMTSD